MSAHPDMPTRLLGRTGEQVSAIGLGGWHLALPHVDEALSHRIVRTAIDRGITFLDNSWDYNDGPQQVSMPKRFRIAAAPGAASRVSLTVQCRRSTGVVGGMPEDSERP